MANEIRFTLDTRQTEAFVRRMRERAAPATARALNRANLAVRTYITQKIAADTRLKSADVKAALVMTDATPSRLVARLAASLKRLPLMKFGAKGPQPSRGRGRGVTAKTQAGKYPHAFIATMPSGHVGVFQRREKDRLPINELKGPSIGKVFEKFAPEGLERGLEALAKNLRSEFRFALKP